MFQTRIASDAVAHQAGLGAAWVFAPTPPGCLWFATLAQLQSCVPADFQARVRASFLMLDYQADEISAAAVLIADDRALLQRLLIDERVRKRAEAISATDEVSVLARSTDITLWLSRLAIITARCRTGLDEYYITFETPADWGNHQDIARRFSHWKRRLDLVHKKRFRCTNTEFALRIDAALIDCRDSLFLAESALERVGNRRDSWLHVRINGSPEDVDVFLHGVARRFCLAWCRKKPDTAVLRSEELPTPVVVRLFDGLAAEFKHLTFSVAVSEPELRYQGGCTCQDDYDRFLCLMEPAFFSENIAPISRILHHRPLRNVWRIRGSKKAVRCFRQTTVKAFAFDCQIDASGRSLVLWGRRMSGTAMTSLMHYLAERFPNLIFRPARTWSKKRFVTVRRPPFGYVEFLNWPTIFDRVEVELKLRYERWKKTFVSSELSRNARTRIIRRNPSGARDVYRMLSRAENSTSGLNQKAAYTEREIAECVVAESERGRTGCVIH